MSQQPVEKSRYSQLMDHLAKEITVERCTEVAEQSTAYAVAGFASEVAEICYKFLVDSASRQE